uniref:Mannose-P-dolichol utilization defect 1 protein homolog n=1 Tax=Fagus sylvatica TaxID=28930 RepID=A0A2N9H615_FAGSY
MEFLGIDFSCALGSLRHGNIPDKDCLLPLISKLLGYCIVAASTTVKLPQAPLNVWYLGITVNSFFNILKILKNSSVRGLSVVAFELEVVGYTIALAYCLHKGLPFSAFGELAFLLIQGVRQVAFDRWPLKLGFYGVMVVVVADTYMFWTGKWEPCHQVRYCAVAPTLLAGQIDPILFEALYASQHAIFLFAKIPQIWKNFSPLYSCFGEQPFSEQNKSTGELSFLTCLMNSAGSIGSESFYQHPGKGTYKCYLGLCNWYCNQWYHPESDNYVPKVSCQRREENEVVQDPVIDSFPSNTEAPAGAASGQPYNFIST